MTSDDSRSSFRLVGLLLAVTAISLAVATFVFFADDSSRDAEAPRRPDEPPPQAAAGSPTKAEREHDDWQGEPSADSPATAAPTTGERKAFLQALARSAKDRAASSEEPSEPPEPTEEDRTPRRAKGPTTTDDLRERWEQESSDPSWTSEMQRQVDSLLLEHDIEGAVDDVSCRESVCRIDVDFADMKEAMDLASKSQTELGPHWIERSREGDELSVRIFVDREGS